MARRLREEAKAEDYQADYGRVSLARAIKLESTRGEGNKNWRMMHAGDLGISGQPSSAVDHTSLHLLDTEDKHGAAASGLKRSIEKHHVGASASSYAFSDWALPTNTYDGTVTLEDVATIAQTGDADARQVAIHYTAMEPCTAVFGRLPDPIRLHEQTDAFDGQVMFIGHPNRDISARQWSSLSCKWVNIGRYAYSSSKVEGSLASDRLRGIEETRATIEYFKLAAKNRETLIVQNGRPRDQCTVSGQQMRAGTDSSVTTDLSTDASMAVPGCFGKTQSELTSSLSLTVPALAGNNVLEDPFVAAIGTCATKSTDGAYVRSQLAGSTGSLEPKYRVPSKATSRATSRTSQSNVSGGAFDRKIIRIQRLNVFSVPILQEVAFEKKLQPKIK